MDVLRRFPVPGVGMKICCCFSFEFFPDSYKPNGLLGLKSLFHCRFSSTSDDVQ